MNFPSSNNDQVQNFFEVKCKICENTLCINLKHNNYVFKCELTNLKGLIIIGYPEFQNFNKGNIENESV